jgi:hypothetical protein
VRENEIVVCLSIAMISLDQGMEQEQHELTLHLRRTGPLPQQCGGYQIHHDLARPN